MPKKKKSIIGCETEVGASQSLGLKAAILIYEGGNDYTGHSSPPLVTVHKIAYPDEKNKFSPVILPGQPVTRGDIEVLSKSLSNAANTLSWLPPTVLSVSASRLVWYQPGQRRRIWFNAEAKDYMYLNGKEVAHPALVFDAEINEGLRILALDDDSRPIPASALYRAPYMNLYSLGEMCRGNSPTPKTFSPEAMALYEASFYESAFSHTNLTGEALTRHPKGPVYMWDDLQRLKKFPAKWLCPLGLARGNRAHLDDSTVTCLGDLLNHKKWTHRFPL